jgi:hypothetical protein
MPWWVGGRPPEKKGRTPDLEGVEGGGGGDVDVVGAGRGKEVARERRRKKGMRAGEGEGMRRELCAPTHAGHSSSQNIITPISNPSMEISKFSGSEQRRHITNVF